MSGLPTDDERSRRIVAQMQADEARHGAEARDAGGATCRDRCAS